MLLPLGVDNLLQSFYFTLHFFVLSNGLSDIFEREYVSHINSFLICLLISAITVGSSSSSIVRSVCRIGNHRRRFIINECWMIHGFPHSNAAYACCLALSSGNLRMHHIWLEQLEVGADVAICRVLIIEVIIDHAHERTLVEKVQYYWQSEKCKQTSNLGKSWDHRSLWLSLHVHINWLQLYHNCNIIARVVVTIIDSWFRIISDAEVLFVSVAKDPHEVEPP